MRIFRCARLRLIIRARAIIEAAAAQTETAIAKVGIAGFGVNKSFPPNVTSSKYPSRARPLLN